jgi:hypothetical protein
VSAPKQAVLAPQDQGYQDTSGGAGWGNRCFRHVKSGRLANARAACERGLEVGSAAEIRGAILYSMGLIEELADDEAAACRWLHESLRVRPGNAPTQAKLTTLNCQRFGDG